ncbi:MAG: VWA domain-containing protein [Cyanobacteria bacterium SZAS TMP-1]|nr:VWA domain-containing protein [Cyanobacteria bacterium SZAS TMP-1]
MSTIKDTALLAITAALAAHTIVSLVYGPAAKSAPPPAIAEATAVRVAEPTATPLASIPDAPISPGKHARLDLAFCIDTTGSMQGEINTVKAKVKSMVAKLSSGQPKPVVRVGLVAYRDTGDAYVTRVFPFSADIDRVVKDISALDADGGGDGPEAVDRGLHAALNELQWDSGKKTARLLYVIGDAPPHEDSNLTAEARTATAKKICVSAISCQGLDGYGAEGLKPFREIAALTNGTFEELAYRQELVDSEGHRATLVVSGGKAYSVKSTDKDAWKSGATDLVAHGEAVPVPSLQGATNGTIIPSGSDASVICGVNTAGTVRVVDSGRIDNNMEDVMLKGAQDAMSKLGK